ncbi:RNA-binding S4 domain-containing protein [bacterium]|nr:MAG: RNA-binding S4 domain-containing protein [bacterium]
MSDDLAARLRLDLYLKRSRLVKRRSLAATLCQNGYVKLNDREASPGKAVRIGDLIEIRYARERLLVEIVEIPSITRKGTNSSYTILSREPVNEEFF